MWGAARQCQGYFCICEQQEVDWGLRGRKTHANRAPHLLLTIPMSQPPSGRSSGVEHNLAKVGVESSNLFARSSFSEKMTIRRIVIRKTPDRKGGWITQISRSTIILRVSHSEAMTIRRMSARKTSGRELTCVLASREIIAVHDGMVPQHGLERRY
jgi:hypothetical protein